MTPEEDYGYRRLQDHCDRLNQDAKGRDPWRVVGEAPNRTVARESEIRANRWKKS